MKERTKQPQGKSIFQKLSSILVLIILFVVLSFLSEYFLTVSNLINIARQISTVVIISAGMTMVILTGGIDLSVGSVAALSGAFMAGMLKSTGIGYPLAVLTGLCIGAVVGLINGLLITKQRMAPFIVTMGTMTITRGFTYIYTGGYPVTGLPAALQFLGQGYVGVIAVPTLIAMGIVAVIMFVLAYTKFGVHIYALGDNRKAAKLVGINNDRVETATYVVSGVLAALAGIIMTCRLNSAQPTLGTGWEMQAIASVIIGGTSFSGGEGGMGGTIIGAVIITVINNGMNLLNVSAFWQQVALGAIILVAVMVDNLNKRRKQNDE